MGKEVSTPAGMRFLISEQTVACDTFSMTAVDSDPGGEPVSRRSWSDGRLLGLLSVVGLPANCSFVEDAPDGGVAACMAGSDVPVECLGLNVVRGAAASGLVDNGDVCF